MPDEVRTYKLSDVEKSTVKGYVGKIFKDRASGKYDGLECGEFAETSPLVGYIEDLMCEVARRERKCLK